MANGINKVILIGCLGDDPTTRYTAAGKAVTNFSVATSESWKDKQSGEKQEKTEWHNITTFDKLADICGQYLKKGSQVYLEGKLQTEKWQDKNGNDRYTTKVICNQMQMLGGRPEGSQQSNNAPQQQSPPQQAAAGTASNEFEPDLDIPF